MGTLLEIDENKPIKQSNRLIEAKYKLTKYEQRMVLAICSQLNTNAESFNTVRVNVADMAKFCNFEERKGYTLVKNTIMKLLTRTLQIHKADGGWYGTHWLQSAEYIPSESVIEYCVDERLKPELLQLKQAYLSTPALPLMKFRSDYSTRFYLLLKKMLKIKDFEYKLDFIREIFQLSKSYKQISNLKNYVIEPAMAEINEQSDINVKHEYVKEGRSFKRIHFIVTLKKQSAEETLEQETGQTRLTGVLDDSVQELADKLIKRGVSEKSAKQIAKKYDSERIERNLHYAVQQKETSTNLPGLITYFIKEDTAGKNAQAQAEAREREKEKQADKRQAREFFNSTENDLNGDYAAPVVIDKNGNIVSR